LRKRPKSLARPGYRGLGPKPAKSFWLPASSYYVLAAAISAAFFFLFWGILHDGRDPTPWIGAGIAASIILGCAVVFREIVLRNARNRHRRNEQMLERAMSSLPSYGSSRGRDKLTLEKNALLLRQIREKSEAAKVLDRLSAGHREVFELCDEYLRIVSKELPSVSLDSPRLVALTRGRDKVSGYHHYHMMRWAEIETRELTGAAKSGVSTAERLESAGRAAGVIEFALRYYPHEPKLIESAPITGALFDSLKAAAAVEMAEAAEFKGEFEQALGFYKNALIHSRSRESGMLVVASEVVDSIEQNIDRIERTRLDGLKPDI
jgi:hypothetical protein